MKYKLSDIMDLIGGGTPKTSVHEYWGGDIPWLSVKDFNNDYRYVYKTEKNITEEGLKNSSTKMLERDDSIISARGTVGEMAMIPFPMAFNQSCYGLRAKKEIVDPTFLYYLVKYNVHILKKNTHGSVFDTITRDTFAGIDVDVPNMDTQFKIAGMFQKLDDKIELNTRINENLARQTQLLFNQWFGCHFGKPIIPTGWFSTNLGDMDVLITDYVANGSFQSLAENVQYLAEETNNVLIRLTDYNNNYNSNMVYISDAAYEFLKKSRLFGDEIIISNVGANVGTVFRCPRLNKRMSLAPNAILLRSKLYEHYLYLLFTSEYGQYLLKSIVTGSAQPKFNKTNFKSLKILIPDKETLALFNDVYTPIYEQITLNQMENIQLANLRDTLLPRLMSGGIDVSNLDI